MFAKKSKWSSHNQTTHKSRLLLEECLKSREENGSVNVIYTKLLSVRQLSKNALIDYYIWKRRNEDIFVSCIFIQDQKSNSSIFTLFVKWMMFGSLFIIVWK